MKTIISAVVLLVAVGSLVESRPKDKEIHHKRRHQETQYRDTDYFGPDPCVRKVCQKGSNCRVNSSGVAECICKTVCKPNHRPICGSDGVIYDNHCELHRAACLKQQKISIMHDSECFIRETEGCSEDELELLKHSLIAHYRTQFNNPYEADDPLLPPLSKKYVVSLIHNHYDANEDDLLTAREIYDAVSLDKVKALSTKCTFFDILRLSDENGDKMLNAEEMYSAFAIRTVKLDENLRTKLTVTRTGASIALACDIEIEDKGDIVWERDGRQLKNIIDLDGIKLYGEYGDGSLHFTKVTVMHKGTYLCYADGYEEVKQTHTLEVQVSPTVIVCPRSQLRSLESEAKLQCYAQGVPEPVKLWKKSDTILSTTEKLFIEDGNTTLRIKEMDYPDTGIYKCLASNVAGDHEATASLFIQQNYHGMDHGPLHVFYVFHKEGIRIFDPDNCGFRHSIPASHPLPDLPGTLCGESSSSESGEEMDCSWGDAVNVKGRYVYVTQPSQNRIIIIDARLQQIHEVIRLDNVPVSLSYIPYLDSVWVVCSAIDDHEGEHTIQVIQKASKTIPRHSSIHTQPIQNRIDLVQDIFIPKTQIPNEGEYKYGYVIHSEVMGISKINLAEMKPASDIDLSQYNCHPDAIDFVSPGGYVIISCKQTDSFPAKQIILNYISDAVIRVHDNVRGKPYVSPDGQYIVSSDNIHGYIYVQKVSPSTGAIKTAFEVSTNLGVSDIAFFATKSATHAYDIYATSRERADILFVDLDSGKVKMIPDVFQPMSIADWPWNEHNRRIYPSGVFGSHLASASQNKIVLIDGKKRTLHCNVEELELGNVMVWVGDC